MVNVKLESMDTAYNAFIFYHFWRHVGLVFAAFVLREHHLFTAQPAKRPETEA